MTIVVFARCGRTGRMKLLGTNALGGVLLNESERILGQIARLSGLRYRPLTFTRELEARFVQSTDEQHRNRRWLEGLAAIALYVVFCLVHRDSLHGAFHAETWIRLGCVVPLALVVNASMLLEAPGWVRQWGVVAVGCLAGSLELALNVGRGQVAEAYAQMGVVAVLVFTNTMMRLRVVYAIVTFFWAALAEIIFLQMSRSLTSSEKILGLSFALSIGAVTVIADYSQSRQERLGFLREQHKEDLVGNLARTNQNLATVAHTDALTFLPNRAALDSHLAELWVQLSTSNRMLSVIVVDVDHFKGLNDRFGHLYGDKVLTRVARLMEEALRKQDDFIARFGGEEFVILLPDTPIQLASVVAERLRSLVELAGLPALPNGEPELKGLRATISCGVAVADRLDETDPDQLLNAADQALYSAKRAGRNRVHTTADTKGRPQVTNYAPPSITADLLKK